MSEHEQARSGEFYLRHAGRIVWPRTVQDLTDTALCPACHTPLKSPVCSACQLNLRHAVASELLASSADAAAAMQRRAELIGRIRYETQFGRVSVPRPVVMQEPTSAAAPLAAAAPVTRSTLPAAPSVFDPSVRPRDMSPIVPVPVPEPLWPGPMAEPAPVLPAPVLPAPTFSASTVPARPQRSSMQVILLSVGVLLVSVAAIFFLTVAWIVTGLGFRSVVVALVTVAALVVAARMRRSRLTATAEGIGSFAVVLVLLDVWGMRQNNLFGLAAGDGALYWGVALTVCTALFLGWHERSNLRVGSVAGFVVAVPGVGLLAAGLAQGQDTLTRVFVGFLGAAVGAMLHRVTLPRSDAIVRPWPAIDRFPERMLLLAFGAIALVVSGILAVFVDIDSLRSPVWSLGAVAVVAVIHSVLVLSAPQSALVVESAAAEGAPTPNEESRISAAVTALLAQPEPPATTAASLRFVVEYRFFAYFAASLAAFAAAGIAPVIAGRYESLAFALTVPLLVATALAAALELFGRRFAGLPAEPGAGPAGSLTVRPGAGRTAGLTAAASAAIVAVPPLVFAAFYAAAPLARATANGIQGREVVTDLADAGNGWALLAVVGVGVILLSAWTVGGLLFARRQVVTGLTLAVVVLAVPFAQSIGVIVGLYLVLGAGALCCLLLARTRFSLGFLAPTFVGLLIIGEIFGYLISWAHPTTWWVGTVSLVLALWFARLLVTPQAPGTIFGGRRLGSDPRAHARGALLAAAIAVTLIGVAHVPLALAPGQSWTDSINLINVTAVLALATALLHVLVAAAALRPQALSLLERRWAFFTLLVPTIIVFALPIRYFTPAVDASVLQPEPIGSILRASLLVGAIALWLFLRANRSNLHWERAIAGVALAPALFLLTREILFATDAVASVFTLAAPCVALVVCSLALYRGTASEPFARRDRITLEAGAAIVLVPAAFTAVVTFRSLGWLVVVLTGIVALIMAIAPDGIFASRSDRRHFGWLSLLLGTIGLWLGLSWNGVVALEPYLLPLAGVVLVMAALIRRYGTIDRAEGASPVAALLTLAGLLIALAPLAIATQSGSLARPIIIILVSAALVLGAGVLRWSPPHSHYLAAAGLAGSIALLITAVAQSARLNDAPGAPDARLELWLVLPATAAIMTAFLLQCHTDAASTRVRRVASIALVLVWASVLTWIELAVVISPADAGLSTPRAVLLVLALSAVHVIALWWPRAPLGVLTAWSVLTLAGLAAFTTVSFGVVDPFELVTVPVALALIGSGWLRLAGDPRARSWPWLGPGLALLLGPSLLLDLTYNDLWRIVSLGVITIVVIVIGSIRRLQAPFVIGAVVLLIHGIAQLWPWIALSYSVIPWFLWLGAGGILLIVLAARYEQRIANLKLVALRIRALR